MIVANRCLDFQLIKTVIVFFVASLNHNMHLCDDINVIILNYAKFCFQKLEKMFFL